MHLLQYRSHVLRLLLNYRLPLYKLEVQNGEMKMWLVGNSFDIQQTESPMVSPEEFNKVAKDFLSVKVPVVRVGRVYYVEIRKGSGPGRGRRKGNLGRNGGKETTRTCLQASSYQSTTERRW